MLSWPESRLQVPGVAHELPPVHRGVVDAVVLVFIHGAFIVQGGGALLAGPRCEHPRGKKSWGHRGREAIRSVLWNAPVFSFSTFVNNNIRAQHRCVLLQLFRMNQTCENLKRSQCFSFYFAAESTEQSRGCFNCGDESEVAGIKSANLFLCDDLKPIRMLRASGSLTCLLCVKVTVRRLRVTLLLKICPTARGQLHKYRDRQMCLILWSSPPMAWWLIFLTDCTMLGTLEGVFFVTSWVINLWAVEMNKHCCWGGFLFTDRLTSMSNKEKNKTFLFLL